MEITHIESKKIYRNHSTDDLEDGYFGNGVYESKVKKNAWSKLITDMINIPICAAL